MNSHIAREPDGAAAGGATDRSVLERAAAERPLAASGLRL